MPLIVLIIIAILVICFVKKRKADNEPIDYSALPDTLEELRDAASSAKNVSYKVACWRKMCDVGINLYQQGKLVAKRGDVYDVNDILDKISSCTSTFSMDKDLEFRCYKYGLEMVEDFHKRARNDPTIEFDFPAEFCQNAWPRMAEYYTEGKMCPRNPALAQKYWRMSIDGCIQTKHAIYSHYVEGLMEVPPSDGYGEKEISKWLALMYGLGALRLKSGETWCNRDAQILQQAAELLYQMDLNRIGSADIAEMLDEYQKGANAGNAYAKYKLGYFYLYGRYVEQDVEKSLPLLKEAAEADLCLAASCLRACYNELSRTCSDPTIKNQYEKLSWNWDKYSKTLEEVVEKKYANSFARHIPGTKDQPTRTAPKSATAEVAPDHSVTTDDDSPFTIMDLPDEIKDAYGNTYRKTSVSVDSADYWGDNGNSATIHLSDIHVGLTGFSAKNSDGYFTW